MGRVTEFTNEKQEYYIKGCPPEHKEAIEIVSFVRDVFKSCHIIPKNLEGECDLTALKIYAYKSYEPEAIKQVRDELESRLPLDKFGNEKEKN